MTCLVRKFMTLSPSFIPKNSWLSLSSRVSFEDVQVWVCHRPTLVGAHFVMGDLAYSSLRASLAPGIGANAFTNSSINSLVNGTQKRKPTTPHMPAEIYKKPKSSSSSSVACSKPPSINFDNVAGLDDTLIQICRLLRPICQPQIYQAIGIGPPHGLLLHGPPGTGKTLLAHAIVGQMRMPFIKLSGPEVVSGVSGQSEQKIRDVFAAAEQNAPCVVLIDEIDAIASTREDASKDMEKRIVSQFLCCMDSITTNVFVIGATNRLGSLDPALRRAGRFDHEVACGIPNQICRRQILELLAKDLHLNSDISLDELAEWTPGYVGADLKAFVREAACRAVDRIFWSLARPSACTLMETDSTPLPLPLPPGDDFSRVSLAEAKTWLELSATTRDDVTCLKGISVRDVGNCLPSETSANASVMSVKLDDFRYALQTVQPSAKREGFATVPDVSWSDIGALANIRHELKLALVAPIRYRESFERLGLNVAAGVLLCGPPGCGKTLLAKAVANESGLNFISVKGPELLNMYVGESERGVRQVFERARTSAPCVIFFDELDALVPRRTASSDSSATSRVVNQLLVEMDGLVKRAQVFVLAATNRPDILDPALLRPGRFDKQVFVGLPDADGIVDILKAITANKTKPPISADVDFVALASDARLVGFTGADAASLVREASMMALKDIIGETGGGDERDSVEARTSFTSEMNRKMSEIIVNKSHFERAMERIKPSVNANERNRYEKMKSNLGM